MARRLNLVLGLTTALFGACSLYLLVRLQQKDACPEADHSALTAQLARSEEARKRLELQLSEPRGLAASGGAGNGPPTPGPSRSSSPSTWRPPELTPEVRALMIRQQYRQVFRELALSDPQVDALVPVLVEQSARRGPWATSANSANPQTPERDLAEVSAVLGPDKGAQFEQARKTMPARSQLNLIRRQLDEAGEPLRDDQSERLLAIMTAHQPQQPPQQAQGESAEQNMERFRTWQAQRDKQFREEADPILTPGQRRQLDEQATIRAAMSAGFPSMLGAAGAPASSRGTRQ